jgi:phosphoenolpyruvate carboxylase
MGLLSAVLLSKLAFSKLRVLEKKLEVNIHLILEVESYVL